MTEGGKFVLRLLSGMKAHHSFFRLDHNFHCDVVIVAVSAGCAGVSSGVGGASAGGGTEMRPDFAAQAPIRWRVVGIAVVICFLPCRHRLARLSPSIAGLLDWRHCGVKEVLVQVSSTAEYFVNADTAQDR